MTSATEATPAAAFELRPHQALAIDMLRERLREGHRRIVLELVTAGGKTAIAIEMIRSAVAKGGRCLFVVNRTQLLEQTIARMESQGLEVGVIQGKHNTRDLHRRVIVGSIASIHMRPETVPTDVSVLVIDEAHACGGDTRLHKMIHRAHANADRLAKEAQDEAGKRRRLTVIGLTATPWSAGMAKNHEPLGGPLFQTKVTPTTADELIEAGYLCDCSIYAPSEPDMTGVKVTAGEYDEDEAAERMAGPKIMGDIVATYLARTPGKKAVAFACNIAHSQNIAQAFKNVGIDARHIDYRMKSEEKTKLLGEFDRGEFSILCNPMLLREGWDQPDVETLIMARPTRSLISWVQIAGRVLRVAPGKKHATILDHTGTALRLGFPTEDRSDEPLDDGKPKSASEKKKKEAKPEALPKACQNCHFLKPAGVHVCPACGHAPIRPTDVQTIDAELTLIKRAPADERRDIRERFGGKQEVFSMLLQYAHERGYKEGFALRQYRDIFGVWPRGLESTREPVSPELRSWLRAMQIRFAKSRDRGASHAV